MSVVMLVAEVFAKMCQSADGGFGSMSDRSDALSAPDAVSYNFAATTFRNLSP